MQRPPLIGKYLRFEAPLVISTGGVENFPEDTKASASGMTRGQYFTGVDGPHKDHLYGPQTRYLLVRRVSRWLRSTIRVTEEHRLKPTPSTRELQALYARPASLKAWRTLTLSVKQRTG